jgi:hypothetical protein
MTFTPPPRRRVLLAVVVCAAVLVPGVANAEQDAVDARAPLIGHVVDRRGVPLPGICLSATAVRGDEENYRTISGKAGRFILDTTSRGYPQRAYQVVLTLCGTRRNVAPEYYLHANDYDSSDWVVVRAGHTTHLDFVLRDAAVITGVVTDVDGRPLVNGCVWTRQWGDPDGVTYDDQRVSYTDDMGRYRLTQLVPGRHRLQAYRQCGDAEPFAVSGGLNAWPDGAPVNVSEGQTLTVDLDPFDHRRWISSRMCWPLAATACILRPTERGRPWLPHPRSRHRRVTTRD